MANQNGIRINLEFVIIVTMALLVLSFQFYNQNRETINKIIYDVFYWVVIGFSIIVLVLAITYNVRVYYTILKNLNILKTE